MVALDTTVAVTVAAELNNLLNKIRKYFYVIYNPLLDDDDAQGFMRNYPLQTDRRDKTCN